MYVHVCDELLPPDIMHDILPYLLKQLVPALRNEGVDLDLINDIVSSYDFGEETNHPYSIQHPSIVMELALGNLVSHVLKQTFTGLFRQPQRCGPWDDYSDWFESR